MSLRPRHYILLAVILGIFAYNVWRNHRSKLPADGPAPVVTTTIAPPAQTPAWSAFDRAAGLRDTPNQQFDPAMQALQKAQATTPSPGISGCLTWLEFYRQGVNHPGNDPQWKDRSERHLNGCVKYHRDTTA
jgi:hypothetical protein